MLPLPKTRRILKNLTDFGGEQVVSEGDQDVMTTLRKMHDLGNRVSDLEPREFAVVTGLAPITDVNQEGFVYAMKGS